MNLGKDLGDAEGFDMERRRKNMDKFVDVCTYMFACAFMCMFLLFSFLGVVGVGGFEGTDDQLNWLRLNAFLL